jgi:hypothetical protein
MPVKKRVENKRGVALLIALLVTALLIALVFEFAYATRVSLRSAVNFRDSERAYYLARSGVFLFLKQNKLRDLIPQKEWGVVPVVSQGDTELRIRWEDEFGKISISDLSTQAALDRVVRLFEFTGVDPNVLERMKERVSTRGIFFLLGELHEVMTDEEFSKASDFISVRTSPQVNIYSASEVVLKSSVTSERAIAEIIADRNAKVSKSISEYGLSGAFTTTSTLYKVSSVATVGEYMKQVDAIISSDGILYWRSL